jgi:hypothetical protein
MYEASDFSVLRASKLVFHTKYLARSLPGHGLCYFCITYLRSKYLYVLSSKKYFKYHGLNELSE